MFKLKLLHLLLAINLMLFAPAAQALFNLSDIGSNILKTIRSIVDPIVNAFTSTTSSLLTSTSTAGTTTSTA